MEQKTEQEKIEHLKDLIASTNILFNEHSLIVDNKAFFTHNKENYRVIMPSPKNLSDADIIKNRAYGIFITTEGYFLENNLKKILKDNQNIDIKELEKEKEIISEKLKREYLDLAGLGSSNDEKVINAKKEKVTKISNDLFDLSREIDLYLQPCIEKQVEKKYIDFLTSSCTQKCIDKEKDKWALVWDSHEDFETKHDMVTQIATFKLVELLLDSRTV